MPVHFLDRPDLPAEQMKHELVRFVWFPRLGRDCDFFVVFLGLRADIWEYEVGNKTLSREKRPGGMG